MNLKNLICITGLEEGEMDSMGLEIRRAKRRQICNRLIRGRWLYLMALLPVIYFIIFKFLFAISACAAASGAANGSALSISAST